tara:strand:+ start:48 stop:677 length:630 start_codon:yes stop_codon:yes gene_type:complete
MDNIDVMLKNAFANKYFSTIVSVVLALYAGALAPALPNKFIEITDTLPGKIIFVFLIGYLSTKNMQLSIMVAVAFVVTLTVVNKNRINEAYSNYNMVKNIEKFYGKADENHETDHADEAADDVEDDHSDHHEQFYEIPPTTTHDPNDHDLTEEEDQPTTTPGAADSTSEQFEDYQNSGTEEFLNPNYMNNQNVVMPATQYGKNLYAPIN